MRMCTADGQSCILTHFTVFVFTCKGIKREVQAFVRPGSKDGYQLILGLPWLYSVDAHIAIRSSTIEIGDLGYGEKRVALQGPRFVQSAKHSLMLEPVSAKYESLVQSKNFLMDNKRERPVGVTANHPSVTVYDKQQQRLLKAVEPDSDSEYSSDDTEDSDEELEASDEETGESEN
jgi:hypothetical protein